MTAAKKTKAIERNGWLFNPGVQEKPKQPIDEVADGTTLRVVRWKVLTGRPCLVRVGCAVTLCGTSVGDAASIGKTTAGDKGGYCNTCLSLSGRGIIR